MAADNDKLQPRSVQLAPDAPKDQEDLMRYALSLEKRLQKVILDVNNALDAKQPKA
jgi:hypothetical protein